MLLLLRGLPSSSDVRASLRLAFRSLPPGRFFDADGMARQGRNEIDLFFKAESAATGDDRSPIMEWVMRSRKPNTPA